MISGSPFEAAIFAGWGDYQAQLVAVTRGLTPEQLATRPAPQLRTAGETLTHLISGRVSWYHDVLGEGDDAIAALGQWEDPDQPPRNPAELTRGLEATWDLMIAAHARWTPEEAAAPIVLPWIGPAHPITRAFVVWHILEHDLHHGGEYTHALGMAGLNIKLPPPPPQS